MRSKHERSLCMVLASHWRVGECIVFVAAYVTRQRGVMNRFVCRGAMFVQGIVAITTTYFKYRRHHLNVPYLGWAGFRN
jgi:hypothetical protein